MAKYYVALQTRAQAILLERRMSGEGVTCELTYMPREIMKDLCNLAVRFNENMLHGAINTLRSSGIPGMKLYREVENFGRLIYEEVNI